MKYAEVQGPLADFQHTLMEQEDIKKLAQTINSLAVWYGSRKKTDKASPIPSPSASPEPPENDEH
jgi:hypothetical protein